MLPPSDLEKEILNPSPSSPISDRILGRISGDRVTLRSVEDLPPRPCCDNDTCEGRAVNGNPDCCYHGGFRTDEWCEPCQDYYVDEYEERREDEGQSQPSH